jgi:hypothetical protein
MTEQQNAYPSEGQPVAASTATETTGPAEQPTSVRARRWLAGAMLVTVGLVAGSGATYAFTSSPTSTTPGTTMGYGHDRFGAGPRGALPPAGPGEGEASPPDQPQGQMDQGTTVGTSTERSST